MELKKVYQMDSKLEYKLFVKFRHFGKDVVLAVHCFVGTLLVMLSNGQRLTGRLT